MYKRRISISALLIINLVLAATHWQCSRKTSSQAPVATSPYVPTEWDGTSDWGGSPISFEDLE